MHFKSYGNADDPDRYLYNYSLYLMEFNYYYTRDMVNYGEIKYHTKAPDGYYYYESDPYYSLRYPGSYRATIEVWLKNDYSKNYRFSNGSNYVIIIYEFEIVEST